MCDTALEVTETNREDALGTDAEAATRGGRVTPALSGAEAHRIADGHYVLRSGVGGRVLDIEGDSEAEAANAQLYHANGTAAQVFDLAWDDDAEAMAISHAGLCLSKEGGDGIGSVRQSQDGVAEARRWVFEPVEGEDGWYFVRNLFGFYLDVDHAVDADGTNVKCWEFNGSPAQRWMPVAVSGAPVTRPADGAYVLRSATGKRVLDIEGDGQAANARLCRPDGTAAQVFDVAYDGATGAMAIGHDGLCLDKEGGDGTGNVWQFEDNGTAAQRWLFEQVDGEDGWFFVRNLHGFYLDAGSALEDGARNVGCGAFDGSASQRWSMVVPPLAYATVTLPDTAFPYAGSPIEPDVRVSLGSRTLEEGVDYDLSFRHNSRVGTASVIVTGTGGHRGSAKARFEIVPLSLDAATVTPADPCPEYCGKPVKPGVEVVLDGTALERGVDYTVSYADNTTVGTATATVTGRGNYEGCASATFEIVPSRTSLKKARVTPDQPSLAYTGEPIEPPVCVTLKGRTLVRGVDYGVAFADNTDAGTATVTVTGTGDYKGCARATFKIIPASLAAATVTPAKSSYAYADKAVKPAVEVVLDGKTLVRGTDYAVSYANNATVGTATVTVTGRGNYEGCASATFEIVPAKVAVSKATAKGKHVTLAWQSQADVSGYQVQVAEDPEFTQIRKATDVLGAPSSKVRVTGLAKGATHYVRVRAFVDLPDMRHYSAWSAGKKAKAK